MIRLLGVLFSVFFLGACTINPVRSSKVVNEDIPPVGQATTVALGEKMMVYKNYEVVSAVVLPVTRSSVGIFPMDMAGIYVIGTEGSTTYYCGNHTLRDPLNNGKVQRVCWTESEFRQKVPSFTTTEMIAPKAGNIQRVLEYTGRIDNRMTFSYREYTETTDGLFIRPAFTQEFTFDLAQGSEIGVKGARLKVVKATNTEITYEVVKHFPR